MVAVAPNADVLSERVRYFIKRERAQDMELARLLDELATPAYLFGGVVRDLALYGKREVEHRNVDIDIVCGAHDIGESRFFMDLEKRRGVARNRFGGFRFMTSRWSVDLWAAEDTWAFREGKFGYESIESLLETTITNWEAVLFRLDGGPLTCKKSYFEDIQRGYLDVVFSENPNALGMYVRLVRACIEWPVQYLSERTRDIFVERMATYSFQDLKSYEEGHYRRRYIDQREYDRVARAVLGSRGGPVCIEPTERMGRLFP